MPTVVDATFEFNDPPFQPEPDLDSWSDESGSSALTENETADEKDSDESEAQSNISKTTVPFANLRESASDIREKDAGDDAERDEQDTKPLDLQTRKTHEPPGAGDANETLVATSFLTVGNSSDDFPTLLYTPESIRDSEIIDSMTIVRESAPDKGTGKASKKEQEPSKAARNKLVPITILIGFGMLSCSIVVAAAILSKRPVSQDSTATPVAAAKIPETAGVASHPPSVPAAKMPAQPLSADTSGTAPKSVADKIETKPIATQNKGDKPIGKNKVAAPRHGFPNNKKVEEADSPHVAVEATVSTLASQAVPPDPESTLEQAPEPETVSPDSKSTLEQAPVSGDTSAIDRLLGTALERPTGRKAADSEDGLPATLSRSQVQSSMKKVEPAVKKCASDIGAQGVANVTLDVSGANGMISKIQVPSVPESLRVCIVREVRKARFPQFKNESMAIQYPFVFPFQ